jgi:hypothetical protein
VKRAAQSYMRGPWASGSARPRTAATGPRTTRWYWWPAGSRMMGASLAWLPPAAAREKGEGVRRRR